jgi:uncharacterized sodium:solute symporter family permease YidK
MKREFRLTPRQRWLFFSLGLIYIVIGGTALIAYVLRDIVGIEIGVHGTLIPLSMLLVVGAGLLIVGRDEPEENRLAKARQNPAGTPHSSRSPHS